MEDNKILDALNDIAKAIEEIAKYSKKKIASSNDILQSVDLGKKMEDIKNGIKNIKKDTEKILKNQETLLNISKEKSKSSPFSMAGTNASKIKNGVSTIVLIAAGVLAIGIAFKLIGQVDFVSVIALSIALPLVAIAFEKIAELKSLKGGDMKRVLFSVVTMSTALMLASWILSAVHPITVGQGLTAILIGFTFAALGKSIESISKGIRNVRPIDIVLIPLVLFTMSVAIMLSSQILRGVHPITIAQGLTSIIIAGTFAVMALSIEKITKGLKNVKSSEVIKLPFVLLAFATAITLSSWVMYFITPLTLSKALTAIALSVALSIMALALPALSYAVNKTDLKTTAKMVAILPLLALSIAMSSWVLQLVVPVKDLGNVILLSIAIGISSIAMAGTIWAISKLGLGLTDILKGGLAVLALATTIMLASWILSVGKYDKYPTLEWAAGVGLSLVAFGLAAVVLGFIAMSGVGALALLAGGAAILVLAGVVVATSYILGAGNYQKYPTFEWSTGVSLSLAAFGAGTLLLGSFILGTFGLGIAVLAAGVLGVEIIAGAIVSASKILGTGTYTGGPTKEWAEGISLSLGAFAPVFKTIFDRGIIGIFSKGPSAKDFSNAITTVSQGIVTAGEFFSNNKGVWSGGPTAEWAAGVGGAIGAFTPVFDALAKSSGLFGSGPTPEDMIQAMISISKGIVEVGKYFMTVPNIWTGGPTSEWSSNISSALSAFAPIFDYLDKNSHWYGNDNFDSINVAILSIAHSMVDSAKVLNEGSFNSKIPAGYMQSMSDNIRVYVDLVEYLQSKDIGPLSFLDTFSITYGLSQLSKGYDKLSKSVKSLSNSLSAIDMEKLNALKSLTGSIVLMSLMDSDQFEKMMDALESKAGIFVKIIEQLEEESTKNKTYGTVNNVKSTTATKTATNDDILGALISIDGKMSKVIANTGNMVTIFDELRGNNNSIKQKKQF